MPVPHRKLVRDRIPEIIAAEGRPPVTRVLDQAAYRQALLDKLVEEAAEAAHASAADPPGELADVLEVLRALTAAAGSLWEQLLALADDKRTRRGGFAGRFSSNRSDKSDKTATQPPTTTGQLANGRTQRLWGLPDRQQASSTMPNVSRDSTTSSALPGPENPALLAMVRCRRRLLRRSRVVEGRVPSVHTIRARLQVGPPRAQRVRAHLTALINAYRQRDAALDPLGTETAVRK